MQKEISVNVCKPDAKVTKILNLSRKLAIPKIVAFQDLVTRL